MSRPPPQSPRSRRSHARPVWVWPAVVVLACLFLTSALAWSAWKGSEARDRARFDAIVQRTDAVIEARIELYVSMLRAGAGLFAASGDVDARQFQTFARSIDLPVYYPGAQGIGYAIRVRPGELAGFEESARRLVRTDFALHPEGARDDYYPILFIEPLDHRNERAIGYDMFSDPVRQTAMARARDLGGPAATARVVLVQEIAPDKQAGFLIYTPVYRGGNTPPTVEARREAIRGFVYSPFRAGDLLAGIVGPEKMARLRLEVFDGATPAADRLLHRSAPPGEERPRFSRATSLRIADRNWSMRYETTSAFETGFGAAFARWILFAGLVVSAALGAVSLALARSMEQSRARRLELTRHKEQLRVTLTSIGDAVVATNEQGQVVFLNRVAEKLTGWKQDEALGRPLSEIVPLLNEEANHEIPSPVDVVLRTGRTVELANHTALVRRDGSRVPVEDSAAPIRTQDGALAGVVLVFHDVTEHRRAEDELRASEERWRLAVEATRLGAWDLDPRGGELHWDSRCRELLGEPGPAVDDVWELLANLPHPDDRSRVREALRQALQPGGTGHCEVECRGIPTKDGRERWVCLTGRAYFEAGPPSDHAGGPESPRPLRFIGTVQDITAEKRREHTLRFLVELGAASQRLAEPEEIFEATARLLGAQIGADHCVLEEISHSEALAWAEATSAGDSAHATFFGAVCARHLLSGDTFVVEDVEHDPRISPDEKKAWRGSETAALIRAPVLRSGRLVAAMSARRHQPRNWSAEEIALVEVVATRGWESAERARALRTLRESEGRFRFLAEAMPQKICTTRPDGGIDYVNRPWADFTGADQSRLLDWNWQEIIHPDDLPAHLEKWRRCLETGRTFQIEHRLRRRDGEYRWHLTLVRPMRDQAGRVSMWIGSSTDITDMVKARETLAGRREELERLVDERTASLREAVEQMEEFSYSISHDLRSPLRAMQGYAQALLDDHAERLDDQGREHLRRIIAASTRMDRLTQDVLTYSRVARAESPPRRISTERLVADCIQQYVEPRGTGAEIVVDHPLLDVLGHEPLLMQALSNLLGNAVKFVPKGERARVRVRTERHGDAVRLWIEDKGIGISPDHQKRIWGMFERVHPKSGYEGTGIGLAIVRKAVERMGGGVGLLSDGRDGSRFWIELPAPNDGREQAMARDSAAGDRA